MPDHRRADVPEVTPAEAIVLAGGFGTRLRSVTGDAIPKPMVRVGGQPFLDHVLLALSNAGVSRTVLAIGHLGEVIERHYGTTFAGMELRWSREDAPLGTGGAVRQAFSQIDGNEALVLNGDTFVVMDIPAFLIKHRHSGAPLTMTIVAVPDVARFGALDIVDERVVRFIEKGTAGPGRINAGVYGISRSLFELVGEATRFSLESDLLQPNITRLRPEAFAAEWMIDIGVPEDFRRAETWFSGNRTSRPHV
jgi:D-glycero-alpha-D-manno-heptose 1-phosphate guanylyltransferase